MKKTVIILITLFIVISLNAIIQWETAGNPVRQGVELKNELCSTSFDDGSIITFWTDTRDGLRKLYAQRVDASGNKLWAEDGLQCGTSFGMIESVNATRTTDNGVVFTYRTTHQSTYSKDFKVQKIDSNGYLLWGQDGSTIINDEVYIHSIKLLAHQDGDVTICWNEYQSNQIRGTRIHADGVVASGWGQDFPSEYNLGIDLLGNSGSYGIFPDPQNDIIVCSNIETDIYIQKISASGEKLFGAIGTLLIQDFGYLNKIELSNINEENFYMATFGGNNELNVYKYSLDAEPLWQNPVLISENARSSGFDLILNDDNYPILVWNDNGIKAQKISQNGDFIWGEDEITIFEHEENVGGDYCFSTSKSFDNGFAIVYEDDYIYNPNSLIFQIFSEDGEAGFENSGYDIFSENAKYIENPELIYHDSSFHILTTRNQPDEDLIIQERLDPNGNSQIAEQNRRIFGGIMEGVWDFKIQNLNGYPLFVWEDNRSHQSQLFFQILDLDGYPIFAENGKAIFSDLENKQRDFDFAVEDNSEIFGVTWLDQNQDANFQALNSSGENVWFDVPITLDDESSDQRDIRISSVDNQPNTFLIAWLADNSNEIKVQKIVSGENQWEENGKVIYNDDMSNYISILDDYIVFLDYDRNFHIYRLDENGNLYPDWPENGLIIEDIEVTLWNPNKKILIKRTESGILVSYLNNEQNKLSLYSISEDGMLLWEDSIIFDDETTTIENYDLSYNNGVYFAWSEIIDDEIYTLRIKKYSDDGTPCWDGEAIEINNNEYWKREIQLTNIEDNILITWVDYVDYKSQRIRSRLVRPAGELYYSEMGVGGFPGVGAKYNPQLFYDNDYVYISCINRKSQRMDKEGIQSISNIYAQKLSLLTTNADEDLQLEENLLSNYPNPFNPTTTINYSLPENAKEASIEIFNIKGQKIYDYAVILSGDEGREGKIIWDGTDSNKKSVSSGVYFYKLNIDGKSIATSKMLLLK